MRRTWVKRVVVTVGVAALALATAMVVVGARFDPNSLRHYSSTLQLLDRHGRTLGVRVEREGVDCRPIGLEQAGHWTVPALLAAEDKRFFRHGGVDPLAILRALAQNLWHRRIVSGASTLSTQVVKLAVPRPRTWLTKFVEAAQAIRMEWSLGKQAVLEQYLNRAPFGANLQGVESASRRYFGKHARDLTLAESAVLMGLPKSPSRLRPDRNPARAAARRDFVLWRMQVCGFITAKERKAAMRQPLQIRNAPDPFRAPHFCDLVQQSRRPTGATLTTLDADVQVEAERIFQRHAATLATQGVHGGALVVLDVRQGAVRALIGSPAFADVTHAGQVNGAVARRSPGSTLKSFVYALAVEEGLCTPATVMADTPVQLGSWAPKNFDEDFNGPVSVREALVRSLNIPALKLTGDVGLSRLVERLRSMGLNTLDRPVEQYGLNLVLGGGEVTLLDLANAYACLARLGEYRPVRLLESEPSGAARRILSREAAYMVADMLGGEERTRELCGHSADARLPRVAMKTGTSAGFRDAWTIAWNPDYVVGVWLGNPDGTPSPALVGGKSATPLVFSVFRALYRDHEAPWYDSPRGLKQRDVCADSGCRPGRECRNLVQDFYLPGISPSGVCSLHTAIAAGKVGGGWSPRMASFLRSHGMADAPAAATTSPGQPLRILSPVPGDTFRLLAGVEALQQEIRISVLPPSAKDELFWFVNGKFFRSASAGQDCNWPLARGRWTLTCATARGQSASVAITVE